MYRIAVAIAEYLHFDMARAFQIAFDQYAIITKGRCAFLPRGAERICEIASSAHHAHTAPATAGNGLDNEREADAPRLIGKK
jgi:hypothetical protein